MRSPLRSYGRLAFIVTILGLGAAVSAQSVPSARFEAEAGSLSGNIITETSADSGAGSYLSFVGSSPPTQGGVFSDTFGSLSNWTFANWTYAAEADRTNNQTTATIDAGKLKIADFDQNYGEAAVRSNVKYNLSQGGTVKFDISLASGSIPSSSTDPGWPWIGFLSLPYSAPSTPCCNGGAPTPQNGIYIRFIKTTELPWTPPLILNHINYAESGIDADGNVLNTVTLAAGKLNRMELRYTPGRMEIWASDSSADGLSFGPLKHIQDYNVTLPPTGYVYLGSHNHASVKYSVPVVNSIDSWFDNISYPAGSTARSYPNGQNVNKDGMTSARVAFNAAYDPNVTFPANPAVIINGHSYPFTGTGVGSQTMLGSIGVDISHVANGNNTITVQGFTEVANIDLILE